jgi:hypothetical protein
MNMDFGKWEIVNSNWAGFQPRIDGPLRWPGRTSRGRAHWLAPEEVTSGDPWIRQARCLGWGLSLEAARRRGAEGR